MVGWRDSHLCGRSNRNSASRPDCEPPTRWVCAEGILREESRKESPLARRGPLWLYLPVGLSASNADLPFKLVPAFASAVPEPRYTAGARSPPSGVCRAPEKAATWLILPVVICLSQIFVWVRIEPPYSWVDLCVLGWQVKVGAQTLASQCILCVCKGKTIELLGPPVIGRGTA